MDLTPANTDKKTTETKFVAITPEDLDTLWNIFKEMEIKLPIHSMSSRIQFDGIIIYWLKHISKNT